MMSSLTVFTRSSDVLSEDRDVESVNSQRDDFVNASL